MYTYARTNPYIYIYIQNACSRLSASMSVCVVGGGGACFEYVWMSVDDVQKFLYG